MTAAVSSVRSTQIIDHGFFLLSYDLKKKAANWALERLVPEYVTGKRAMKGRGAILKDPQLEPQYQRDRSDYRGSGWSRGHLAAIGNYVSHREARKAVNVYSNILAQDRSVNGGVMSDLEQDIRIEQRLCREVFVLTGAVWGEKVPVVGLKKLPVPESFYKVVLRIDEKGRSALDCFLIPNDPSANKKPYEGWRTTASEVERVAKVPLRLLGMEVGADEGSSELGGSEIAVAWRAKLAKIKGEDFPFSDERAQELLEQTRVETERLGSADSGGEGGSNTIHTEGDVDGALSA